MPDEVNVADMVAEYLKKNKFEGLCDTNGECGCELDDLFPCESKGVDQCEPGYKVPCSCGEGCDFHISTKKPS